MLKRYRSAAIGLCALLVAGGVAWAAGNYSLYPVVGGSSFCISTVSGAGGFNAQGNVGGGGITGQGQSSSGSLCAQTVPAGPPLLTGSELVPADTGLPGTVSPQTVVIPIQLLSNFSGTPRNYLDNGSLNIQQRGTGTVTCAAAAAITSAAYGPDRWGCSANVTSGAGRQAIVTTAALLPAGFAAVDTVWRNSGSLGQPVCVHQEIPTLESTALAGKTVALSFYSTALAGLSADNQNQITASIYYGTGSDQGFGTMTASPAITPAWTNIAFSVNQQTVAISTTPTRYSVTGTLPATATEVGVALCFTPTTSTSGGVTDGFAFVGAQLEIAPSPSAYEFHTVQADLAKAQRYFYSISEAAANVAAPTGIGNYLTTTVCTTSIPFPVTMRVAPTYTNSLSATTFKLAANAVAPIVLATPFSATSVANTVNNASIGFTTAAQTVNISCGPLVGAAGGGTMQWSADF